MASVMYGWSNMRTAAILLFNEWVRELELSIDLMSLPIKGNANATYSIVSNGRDFASTSRSVTVKKVVRV